MNQDSSSLPALPTLLRRLGEEHSHLEPAFATAEPVRLAVRERYDSTTLQAWEADGIVELPIDHENDLIEALDGIGYRLQPQYECVRADLTDPTVLETVARTTAADAAETSASKAKSTVFHQDGYQFSSPYRGFAIAGFGAMPDVEILGYPVVVERRVLFFTDLHAACRELLAIHGPGIIDVLASPRFVIDPRYVLADPALRDVGSFPIIAADGSGWRYHIGGSVWGADAEAGFALSLFRLHMHRVALSVPVREGRLYMVNQRRTAHLGVRVEGIPGLTRPASPTHAAVSGMSEPTMSWIVSGHLVEIRQVGSDGMILVLSERTDERWRRVLKVDLFGARPHCHHFGVSGETVSPILGGLVDALAIVFAALTADSPQAWASGCAP